MNQKNITLILAGILTVVIISGLSVIATTLLVSRFSNTNTDSSTLVAQNDVSTSSLSTSDKSNAVQSVNTISQSLSSEVSSVNESKAQQNAPEKKTSNKKTYTNPFFPNFSLTYGDDWTFNTATASSPFEGLLSRTMTLTKGDYIIRINSYPQAAFECGGYEEKSVKLETFSNGIIKYNELNYNGIVYTKNKDSATCEMGNEIQSTIKKADFPEYVNFVNEYGSDSVKKGSQIAFNFRIEVSKFNNAIANQNDPMIKEIDEIISQSVFR